MGKRRGVDPEPRVFFMHVVTTHEVVVRVTIGEDEEEASDEEALTMARDTAIQYVADLITEGDFHEDAKMTVEQVEEDGPEPLHGAITVTNGNYNEYDFDDDDPQGR
jgi:hypothetical protein